MGGGLGEGETKGRVGESRVEAAPHPKAPFQAESSPGRERQRPSWFFLCLHPGVYTPATPWQESCHHQLREQEIGSLFCFEDVSIQADQKLSPEAAVSSAST